MTHIYTSAWRRPDRRLPVFMVPLRHHLHLGCHRRPTQRPPLVCSHSPLRSKMVTGSKPPHVRNVHQEVSRLHPGDSVLQDARGDHRTHAADYQ